jgi:ABC-type Fe3+/spermidine/putrescine transport system ATPase subunit
VGPHPTSRVALARAIPSEPAVLLVDEPLSNLDAKLREDVHHAIKTLVHQLNTTPLNVTHDQLQALSTSDRVALDILSFWIGAVSENSPARGTR